MFRVPVLIQSYDDAKWWNNVCSTQMGSVTVTAFHWSFDVLGNCLWSVTLLDAPICIYLEPRNENGHGLTGLRGSTHRGWFCQYHALSCSLPSPHSALISPRDILLITPILWMRTLRLKELVPGHLANKLYSQNLNLGRALMTSLDSVTQAVCNSTDLPSF